MKGSGASETVAVEDERNRMNEPKTVVITGGGGGLGSALAAEFRTAGWRVLAPPRAELDVTDAEAVGKWFAAAGPVDLLVNNAGAKKDSAFSRLAEADWDHVQDVCLRGAFLCARAVLPAMAAAGRGHVVNIGSTGSRKGVAGQAAYSAAKAGLLGLTQSLAREHGADGVRVNAVLPGWLDTAFTADVSPATTAAAREEHALGRFNTVEDAARFIRFLDSMSHVSGQTFQLDSRISRWG